MVDEMNHALLQRMLRMAPLIKAVSPRYILTIKAGAEYVVILGRPSASYMNGTGLTNDSCDYTETGVPGSKKWMR